MAIRAAATTDLLTVWGAFDPTDIDGSWAVMEPAVEAIVRDYRRQSSNIAAGYFQAYRTAEGVPGTSPARLAAPPSREVLRYSLGYYGRVVPNRMLRAGRLDVSRQAAVHLIGGVARHVQDGGRRTIIGSVAADRQAHGWMRVTDGDPCAFCAMLAGRGGVYSKDTVDFQAHDHCGCTVAPSYTGRASDLPDANRRFREQWDKAQQGEVEPGLNTDPFNRFRRLFEAG